MTTNKKTIQNFRAYQPNDKEQILDLFERVWGKNVREAHAFLWDWKHLQDNIAPAMNVARILEINGKTEGYSGSIPATVRVDDKVYFSTVVMDTAVDPGRRGHGLKLLINQFKGTDVIYGVPIDLTKDIWAKIVRRSPKEIIIKKHLKMYRVIDPAHILRRKGVPSFLRPFVTLVLKLYLSLLDMKTRGDFQDCRLENVDIFPEEIDSLCNEYAKYFKFIALRDNAFLNWRYAQCPIPYEKILLRRGGDLGGYMVYRPCSIRGRKVLLILEAAAVGKRNDNYQVLLSHAVAYAKKNGIIDIQTLDCGCPLYRKVLKKKGFIEKPGINPFIGTLNDELMAKYKDEIINQNKFHLTLGDGDFEFIFFAFDGNLGLVQ